MRSASAMLYTCLHTCPSRYPPVFISPTCSVCIPLPVPWRHRALACNAFRGGTIPVPAGGAHRERRGACRLYFLSRAHGRKTLPAAYARNLARTSGVPQAYIVLYLYPDVVRCRLPRAYYVTALYIHTRGRKRLAYGVARGTYAWPLACVYWRMRRVSRCSAAVHFKRVFGATRPRACRRLLPLRTVRGALT